MDDVELRDQVNFYTRSDNRTDRDERRKSHKNQQDEEPMAMDIDRAHSVQR